MNHKKKALFPMIDSVVNRLGIILGISLALTTYIGHEVWTTAGIDGLFISFGVFFKHLIYLSVLIVLLCFFFILVLHYLSAFYIPTSEKYFSILSKKRTWFILWIIMVAMHLLCYVAYFPGIFSYDIQTQAIQAGGWAPYSNHQPIFHTLLWKAVYTIELKCKMEGLGIILFSLTQICVMSTIFVYTIYFMAKRQFNQWILLLTFLFYAVTPTLTIFTLIPTKDVPFSGGLIIFTLCLVELREKGKTFFANRVSVVVFIISGTMCCLLRNNGIYVIFLVGIMVCVSFRQKGIYCFVAILLLYFIIMKIITLNIDVTQSPAHEKLSIPITQISNVYVNKNKSLSEEEKQLILTYIPTAENYNPCFADSVKDDFNDERFIENKGEFMRLWWQLFLREPVCYINAFLSLNINFWYPGTVYPNPYSSSEYIETNRWKGEYINIDVPFPALHRFYESFAKYENPIMRWPIFSFFFSICSATVLWFVSLICIFARRRKDLVLPFLTAGFLMLTYMAGPTSAFRYVYSALVLLPIYWAIVLQPELIIKSTNS